MFQINPAIMSFSQNDPLPFTLSEESFDDFEQSIPLLSDEEERKLHDSKVPDKLPILPLKNTVLFPGVVIPITVGRDRSLALVKKAYETDRIIGVVTQRKPDLENPQPEDLYTVGTVAQILKLIKMPDGSKSIVIQGKRLFKIKHFTQSEPFYEAEVESYPNIQDVEGMQLEAAIRSIKETAVQIVNISPNIPSEAAVAINNINSPTFLLNFITSNLNISLAEKQEILEKRAYSERLDSINRHLSKELQVLSLSQEIRTKVNSDIQGQQRDFYLRQQLKAIQEELGEDNERAEIDKIRERAEKKMPSLPENVQKVLQKEIDRLSRTPTAAPNYGITLNYVDWILDLPWNTYSTDRLDLKKSRKVLDTDHYGLEKVKKRIIEYLAVLKLKADMKAPIVCFVGPPGVGKTSLGKSIASSLGREFVRISLGGLHDEAEIRGHRKTYIGALPGRIIQSLKKAGTSNPVMMLDEIDKVGRDYRGDPTSALLEVLDPEQNHTFYDNYMELEYDLSKVLFIATANSLDTIPGPLRDRMEIIPINGYTLEEKLQIAKKYLVPKQLEENGLKKQNIRFTDKGVEFIIDGYTRESGVRNLNREIGSVSRGIAAKVAMGDAKKVTVGDKEVVEYLGKRRFFSDVAERTTVPGVATGMAYTSYGGDILFIEASISPGSGRLSITGQLGDVMKESAMLGVAYLKANAARYGIPDTVFTEWDLHLHVPAGAVPKDGPSAGVSMLSALTSVFTLRRVKSNLALTGEITLRGQVLPVGGIKEKVLAARRAGIAHVILPAKNEPDVYEIEKDTLGDLQVTYVDRMEKVIELVLEDQADQNPFEVYKTRKKKVKPAAEVAGVSSN
jgi:ATP-dependent Lon protease